MLSLWQHAPQSEADAETTASALRRVRWLSGWWAVPGKNVNDFNYIYAWGKSPMRVIDRKGQRCRVVARGKMNSCLLEFIDGFKVVTSRNALRRVK